MRLPRRRAENAQQELPERTYRAALARAAGLVGSARALSVRLRVPMADLTRWLIGEGKPTIDVFLRVVDILVEEGNKTQLALAGEVIPFHKPPESAP